MTNDVDLDSIELLDTYLNYLDTLRESGATNMLGATSYLQDEFPELSHEQARRVHAHCMLTGCKRLANSNNEPRRSPMNPKISILVDLALGITLASILALGDGCPVADSIIAGLVLMIVLMLIDVREDLAR